MCSTLQLQPDPWSIFRAVIKPGDKGVHPEPEVTHCKTRTTINGVLRQWEDLCSSSQVVKKSAQGREIQ